MLKLGNGPPLPPFSCTTPHNRNNCIHRLLVDGSARWLWHKVLHWHSTQQVCPSALLLEHWLQRGGVICPGLFGRPESKTFLSWYCFCVPSFGERHQKCLGPTVPSLLINASCSQLAGLQPVFPTCRGNHCHSPELSLSLRSGVSDSFPSC